jgi:hypothetical protein
MNSTPFWKCSQYGQVHSAVKNNKTSRKIQYPGVANSISSDLAMVKPIAIRMFNLQGKDSDKYFKEVEEDKLKRPIICSNLNKVWSSWPAKNRKFSAEYYPEFSSEKIYHNGLDDWNTPSELQKSNTDQETADTIVKRYGTLYVSNSY